MVRGRFWEAKRQIDCGYLFVVWLFNCFCSVILFYIYLNQMKSDEQYIVKVCFADLLALNF